MGDDRKIVSIRGRDHPVGMDRGHIITPEEQKALDILGVGHYATLSVLLEDLPPPNKLLVLSYVSDMMVEQATSPDNNGTSQ